jgi:hypothetical protein
LIRIFPLTPDFAISHHGAETNLPAPIHYCIEK